MDTEFAQFAMRFMIISLLPVMVASPLGRLLFNLLQELSGIWRRVLDMDNVFIENQMFKPLTQLVMDVGGFWYEKFCFRFADPMEKMIYQWVLHGPWSPTTEQVLPFYHQYVPCLPWMVLVGLLGLSGFCVGSTGFRSSVCMGALAICFYMKTMHTLGVSGTYMLCVYEENQLHKADVSYAMYPWYFLGAMFIRFWGNGTAIWRVALVLAWVHFTMYYVHAQIHCSTLGVQIPVSDPIPPPPVPPPVPSQITTCSDELVISWLGVLLGWGGMARV